MTARLPGGAKAAAVGLTLGRAPPPGSPGWGTLIGMIGGSTRTVCVTVIRKVKKISVHACARGVDLPMGGGGLKRNRGRLVGALGRPKGPQIGPRNNKENGKMLLRSKSNLGQLTLLKTLNPLLHLTLVKVMDLFFFLLFFLAIKSTSAAVKYSSV